MRIIKKPEERRAEMVSAAADLFAQKGFVRTSVAEIVSAVDVAKGLFYYYFTTKDDMVRAVVEVYCEGIESIVRSIAQSDVSGSEKLELLFRHPVWNKCFTQPLIRDLCLPQNLALYTDMCDRLCAHIGPNLAMITAQILREKGMDDKEAGKYTGIALYGILMMARTGHLTIDEAHLSAMRIIGID